MSDASIQSQLDDIVITNVRLQVLMDQYTWCIARYDWVSAKRLHSEIIETLSLSLDLRASAHRAIQDMLS